MQQLCGYMTAAYKCLKEMSTALGKGSIIISTGEAMQTLDKHLGLNSFNLWGQFLYKHLQLGIILGR